MRIALGVVIAASAVMLVAGCSSHDSSDDSMPKPTPVKVSPQGPFFGECGGVTDAEVASAVASQPFPTVFRNSVGCVWQSDNSLLAPSVSFSWYRGSPIGREAAGSGLIGRPAEKIEVQGHPGFRGAQRDALSDICEIGVQFGDDFLHWSVSYGSPPQATADSCAAAMQLANLTASRVK